MQEGNTQCVSQPDALMCEPLAKSSEKYSNSIFSTETSKAKMPPSYDKIATGGALEEHPAIFQLFLLLLGLLMWFFLMSARSVHLLLSP